MVNAVELPVGTGDVVLVGEGSPTRKVLNLQGDKDRVVCRGSKTRGYCRNLGVGAPPRSWGGGPGQVLSQDCSGGSSWDGHASLPRLAGAWSNPV